MNSPVWIDAKALRLLHGESLAEHSGLSGMRNEGLLMSALARPLNLFAYEGVTDIPRLAAAYAYGITEARPAHGEKTSPSFLAKNHPFADGNKRAAFLCIGLFLALNGYSLQVEQKEAVNTILALAAGDLDESALTAWIAKYTV